MESLVFRADGDSNKADTIELKSFAILYESSLKNTTSCVCVCGGGGGGDSKTFTNAPKCLTPPHFLLLLFP